MPARPARTPSTDFSVKPLPDPLSPYDQFWLIFGLIAWALSAATGILFLGPEAKRLNKAAAAHGPQSPEVQERLSRILLVVRVDVAPMFLIVFDMVAKPFSS